MPVFTSALPVPSIVNASAICVSLVWRLILPYRVFTGLQKLLHLPVRADTDSDKIADPVRVPPADEDVVLSQLLEPLPGRQGCRWTCERKICLRRINKELPF